MAYMMVVVKSAIAPPVVTFEELELKFDGCEPGKQNKITIVFDGELNYNACKYKGSPSETVVTSDEEWNNLEVHAIFGNSESQISENVFYAHNNGYIHVRLEDVDGNVYYYRGTTYTGINVYTCQ